MSDSLENKPNLDGLVKTYYEMNPETDDILPSGKNLQWGMRVLIENPEWRANSHNDVMMKMLGISPSIESLVEARKLNRWCEVSYVHYWEDGNVTFIGTYDDGVKCQRTAPISAAWLVKKDSVPVETKSEDRVWREINGVMIDAALIDRRQIDDDERTHITDQMTRYVDQVMELVKHNVGVFRGEDTENMNDGEDDNSDQMSEYSEYVDRVMGIVQGPEYLMDPEPSSRSQGTDTTEESYSAFVDYYVDKMYPAGAYSESERQQMRNEFHENPNGIDELITQKIAEKFPEDKTPVWPEFVVIWNRRKREFKEELRQILTTAYENDSKIRPEPHADDELVTELIQNERDKQTKWLEEKARRENPTSLNDTRRRLGMEPFPLHDLPREV